MFVFVHIHDTKKTKIHKLKWIGTGGATNLDCFFIVLYSVFQQFPRCFEIVQVGMKVS